MNKNGLVFHWLVIIPAFFIALGLFLYYFAIPKNEATGGYIGAFHLNLIKNFQKGDNMLLYIDQSSKYSLQQAIYDLAANGGISEIDVGDTEIPVKADCGKFDDANVWFELIKNKEVKTPD